MLQSGEPNGGDDAPILAALDGATESLAEAQREIRVLSYLLHPPHLRSRGLAEALDDFASGFAMRAGLKMKVAIAPEASAIADDVAVHLFRVCQEALTNVYRHANARKAEVTLKVADSIRLTVKDDGIGFDASAADRVLSVGLPGMRDRMARLGGAVEIRGDPNGTTLVATLPLENAQVQASGARSAA
jgi:signal transduction histidine kinase